MPASPRVTIVRPRRAATQRSSSETISDSSAWRPANGRLCAPSARRRPSESNASPGFARPASASASLIGSPESGNGPSMRVGSSAPWAMPAAGAPGVRSLAPTAWMIACAARSARCGSLPVRCSRPKTATRRSPESRSAMPPCSVTASSNSRCSLLRQLARLFRVERAALRGEARQAHREHDTRLQHAIVGGGGRGRPGGERRWRPRPRARRPAARTAARSRRRGASSSARDTALPSRDPARGRARGAARCAAPGTGAAPPCSGRRARSRP